MLEEVKKSVQSGDLARARDLLTRLLKSDQQNPEYWLWMSAAVPSKKEKIYCLKQVLAYDPHNAPAQAGLQLLGETVDPAILVKHPMPKPVDWKTSLELQEANLPSTPGKLRNQLALFIMIGVVAVSLLAGGIWLSQHPLKANQSNEVMRWSLTPPATAVADTPTPMPTSLGPAPLWTKLEATFTATPLFVSTPHNRVEAYSAAMRAYEQQNWPKVVEYLNQVLVDEPNSPDVLYHLGDAYRFLGKYSEAKSAYEKAVSADPSFAPGYLGLGRVMLDQQKTDAKKAAEYLTKAVELNPSLYESYIELTRASLMLEDPGAALTWVEKLDELLPDSGLVEYYRAQIYLQQEKFTQALTAVKKSNKLDITYLPTYLLWGQILQASEKYENSLEPLETYLVYEPLDNKGQILIANAYLHLDRVDEALEAVNSVLESQPTNVDAVLLRGEIELKQEKADAALADFETVLKKDPDSFEANLGRGKALLGMDTAGSAYMQFVHMEDTAETDREKTVLLYWRAISLEALDETAAAILDWQSFFAYSPDLVDAAMWKDAEEHYFTLVTPTPSATLTPSLTPTVTATPKPVTPTPTK